MVDRRAAPAPDARRTSPAMIGSASVGAQPSQTVMNRANGSASAAGAGGRMTTVSAVRAPHTRQAPASRVSTALRIAAARSSGVARRRAARRRDRLDGSTTISHIAAMIGESSTICSIARPGARRSSTAHASDASAPSNATSERTPRCISPLRPFQCNASMLGGGLPGGRVRARCAVPFMPHAMVESRRDGEFEQDGELEQEGGRACNLALSARATSAIPWPGT